jgi:hypothetical protein
MWKFSIEFSTSTTVDKYIYRFLAEPAPLGLGMTSEEV